MTRLHALRQNTIRRRTRTQKRSSGDRRRRSSQRCYDSSRSATASAEQGHLPRLVSPTSAPSADRARCHRHLGRRRSHRGGPDRHRRSQARLPVLLPPPETALGAGAAEYEEAVGAAATGAGDEAAEPALDCVVRLLPEGGALVAAPGAVLPVVLGGARSRRRRCGGGLARRGRPVLDPERGNISGWRDCDPRYLDPPQTDGRRWVTRRCALVVREARPAPNARANASAKPPMTVNSKRLRRLADRMAAPRANGLPELPVRAQRQSSRGGRATFASKSAN